MSLMAKRDYYQVLGVSRQATPDQIKSAYRKLARKFHPDVNKSPDASEKFKEATEAYDVLSDQQKRQMYDQFGHNAPRPGPGGAAGGRYEWSGGAPGGINIEDIFGGAGQGFSGMSLDEILEMLGGTGRGRRAARPPRKGQDVEYEVSLDFLAAVRGTTAPLRISDGRTSETLNVKVPPGVKDGSRIRIHGKGQAGPGGRGDLYMVVRLREHPYFRREEDDIYVDVPISITEAALGAVVEVPTIDGITKVRIPPGSSSNLKLRLRGRGVAPPGKEAGDQYVVLKVLAPPKISAKGQELLREFDRQEPFNPRKDAPWT
jgi:curved DNA-binding protein